MKNNKYKILVLSDLKENTTEILKSSVSLAKIIGGEVKFFHVKKPTDVVERESQLSAFRTINEQHTVTKKGIEKFVDSASKAYGVAIDYSYAFGNVKNEIKQYIKENQPDVIVLGKRKSMPISLIGDKVINFILKKYDGMVMIVDDKNTLEPNKKLSIGLLSDAEQLINVAFADDLIKQTDEPLKSFRIVNSSNNTPIETDNPATKKTVEYVFEHNDNTISNLSNYLSKSSINLLCVDRSVNNGNTALIKSDIKNIVNKTNVSMLLTARYVNN